MNSLTEIFNLPPAKQLEFFIQNCSNTKEIQQSILKEIIRKNKSTEIGKKFNFEKIKSMKILKLTVLLLIGIYMKIILRK
jgi:hypothetical protein